MGEREQKIGWDEEDGRARERQAGMRVSAGERMGASGGGLGADVDGGHFGGGEGDGGRRKEGGWWSEEERKAVLCAAARRTAGQDGFSASRLVSVMLRTQQPSRLSIATHPHSPHHGH